MITASALEIIMVARKRYPLASWAYAALDLARAGLFVAPVLVFPGLSGLLAGAVAFAAIRCGLGVWYLGREFRGGGLYPDAGLFRAQLAYAMPLALAGLVEILQASFHQYFVAYRTDPATFAIYAVGCLQIPLVEVATASVLNVMMVRMSEQMGAGRDGAAVAVWHDSTRKLALLFAPMVGLLVVTAHPIIVLLFTARYAEAVPVFVVSSLGLLLPVIAVDAVLRVRAETRTLFGLNLVRLAVTIALIIPWSPRSASWARRSRPCWRRRPRRPWASSGSAGRCGCRSRGSCRGAGSAASPRRRRSRRWARRWYGWSSRHRSCRSSWRAPCTAPPISVRSGRSAPSRRASGRR